MKKVFTYTIIFVMFVFFFIIEDNKQVIGQKKTHDQYSIMIDPGHGGYDGGAHGVNGIIEKDVNLDVALYLRNYLEQAGINVLLTRKKDMDYVTPGSGTKKKRDLDARIKMMNESDIDFYISIHMNSLRNPRWHGAQTFYYKEYEDSKKLAEQIQQSLISVLQNTKRHIKSTNRLYLFKQVEKPGVLVEAGFLSNPYEANLLKQKAYQDKVAFAIYLGILQYLIEDNH